VATRVFSFAGLHFGDLAGVKDDAADHLDVEVTHLDGGRLPASRTTAKAFGEDGVEGRPFSAAMRSSLFSGVSGMFLRVSAMRWRNSVVLARRASSERGLNGGLEGVDLRDDGHKPLDGAFVAGAKDFSYEFVEQNVCPS